MATSPGVMVLRSRSVNHAARARLKERGISCLTPWWRRLGLRARILKGASVGHALKSWDVLETLEFLSINVSRNAKILDLGAFGSELMCILGRSAYSHVVGVDLNPELRGMPREDGLHYLLGDFYLTPFAAGSFKAITAISVIEHGFKGDALLREISRLLSPSGFFLASFDYWPEKIETGRTRLFGMDWCIFSKEEVIGLLQTAEAHGLVPLGEVTLDVDVPSVTWEGSSYTFVWMALQKQPDEQQHRRGP